MSLSVVSLNTRGLRENVKRKALFLFAKQFKTDFVFFQETHSVGNDVKFWRSQWNNDLWFAHGSERSAGVATLKNTFSGNVLEVFSDHFGHFLCLLLSWNNSVFILVNIYGYNLNTENTKLFESLEERILLWFRKHPQAFLLIGGDFNITINDLVDRWPPKQPCSSSVTLKTFMQKYNLIDAWRELYPNKCSYTWSNKNGTRQSRIDFFLVSRSILIENMSVNIIITPLTDHKAISINIRSSSFLTPCRTSFWKMNISHLRHEAVKSELTKLISFHWDLAQKEGSFSRYWELLKYEVGKYLRSYGSFLSKLNRILEEQVVSDITCLSMVSPDKLLPEEKIKLSDLQNKLDEIYKRKTEGAFVRSRIKWLEQGEQNSSYFFNLERQRGKRNTIHHLNINGTVTNDPKAISLFCYNFYANLYRSNYCSDSATSLLNSLKNTNTISDLEKECCDKNLVLDEVIDAIKLLKCNKSPGCDGIASEFYKQFSDILAPFLLNVFTESIKNHELPPSLSQGIINLIPKPKKDLLLIENWRPISLLNNDYKILAIILSKRIKNVLNSIIDETQSGFLNNRHISNNIRLVLDIIDYSNMISDDSFLLFLDFYKAFDTLEHHFIFQCLEKFGFGTFFCSAIKTLYMNGSSSVILKNGTTRRFELLRGIRQGCPISPYLFLLAAQILCSHIKASSLKGVTIAERQVIISQLADDTTLFLKDESQISLAINIIDSFSKASGLYLNIKKCELFAIKDCNESSVQNIPVKERICYLGVLITKDPKERCNLNYQPLIDKTEKRFNQWLQRDLSLKGRVLLTKAEGLSRLIYVAQSVPMDPKLGTRVDKLLFNFVWKRSIHYIRKSVVMNTYDKGGLNFLDFCTLSYTLKINWLKQFRKKPGSIWNFISNYIFSQFGGLEFLLMCNYKIDKLPAALSDFHRQVLLAWSLIFKHNFSPHRSFIWNNCNVLYKNKSIFFQSWFDKNILLISQLMNSQGLLLSYKEFLDYFQFPVSPREFSIVMDSIPSGVIALLRGTHSLSQVSLNLVDTFIGRLCFAAPCKNNNRIIRSIFQQNIVTLPAVTAYWNNAMGDICWKKVWLLPHTYLLTNKIKEISYKIIHKFYPAKHYMKKFKSDISSNCSFCDDSVETVVHLFWYCSFTKKFWQEVLSFIRSNIYNECTLFWKNVVLGFFEYEQSKRKQFYVINLILLLAKFHIHRCKYSNSRPLFLVFIKEFEQYLLLIQLSKNKKASKTLSVCNSFPIFNAM